MTFRFSRLACFALLVALARGMPPFSVGFSDHPKHPRVPGALPSYLEDEIEYAVRHGKDAKSPQSLDHRR